MLSILSGVRFLQQFGSWEAVVRAAKTLQGFRNTMAREMAAPKDHFIYNTGNATQQLFQLEQRQDRSARSLYGVQW